MSVSKLVVGSNFLVFLSTNTGGTVFDFMIRWKAIDAKFLILH